MRYICQLVSYVKWFRTTLIDGFENRRQNPKTETRNYEQVN